jgi:spectinomycin phosphotransferase
MLEKPDIPESLIISSVQVEYGLEVASLTFLPLGYDVNTSVYRLGAIDGADYFLKLCKGNFQPTSVEVPHFLSRLGICSIIDPLETLNGYLFGRLEPYTFILYPYIAGNNGYEVELEDQHWVELGTTLKQVHSAQLPEPLAGRILHEVYDPAWRENTRVFQEQVEKMTYRDPVAHKLAGFMRTNGEVIRHMLYRAEMLAQTLKANPPDHVLCHTDVHPGNYLITPGGALYLVDWDNPLFAPKERDLMFFGAGMHGQRPGGWEEQLFYQGYGSVEINRHALAYYRFERIIQDIAEFCKQLFMTESGGSDREQAYHYFTGSFAPGCEVDAAMLTDQQVEP